MTSTASEPQVHLGPAGRFIARGLSQRWWVLLLRGLAAIAFGVAAFMWPGLTIVSLALVWGVYAFADGLTSLTLAVSLRDGGAAQRWWMAIVGVIGILAGVAAFLSPLAVAGVLLLFIAGWAIAVGALQIWGAIQLRKEISGEWMLILCGLLTIAFGVLLAARPAAGALSLIWVIASYALIIGVLYVLLSFRVRALKKLA
jgi:uncharacterized membrane protein HdeD (DUF308 family)